MHKITLNLCDTLAFDVRNRADSDTALVGRTSLSVHCLEAAP